MSIYEHLKNTHYYRKKPQRWRSRSKRLPRMWKVGCSKPGYDRSVVKTGIDSLLPNTEVTSRFIVDVICYSYIICSPSTVMVTSP